MTESMVKEIILAYTRQSFIGDKVLYLGAVSNQIGLMLASDCGEVTLLDSDEQRINEANRALFIEDRSIRRKINYILGDFQAFDFACLEFDTIIIVDPEKTYTKAIYAKASTLLSDDGNILVIGDNLSAEDLACFFNVLSFEKKEKKDFVSGQKKKDADLKDILVESIANCRLFENETLTLKANIDELLESKEEQKQTLLQLGEETLQLRKTENSKTDTINDLTNKVKAQEGMIKAQEATIVDREATIKAQEAVAKAQEETIVAQSTAAKAQEETIVAQSTAVKAQEATIVDRNATIKALEDTTMVLKNKVREAESKRKTYEAESLKYQNLYKKIKTSRRYKAGAALSDIAKHPFKIFSYFFKFLKFIKRDFSKKKRVKSPATAPVKSLAAAPVKSPAAFKGISVIIPTYKEQPFFEACLNSVLGQTLDEEKIEIIISVNGSNYGYYKKLRRKYFSNKRIKVIYTETPGLSSGRNKGLLSASMDYITFLDDDDYFTEGYLEELASHIDEDITIVCGRLVDEYETGIDPNTYINRELSKICGGGKTDDYLAVGSLFSSAWAKLYRIDLIRDSFSAFDEQVMHTEDIRFWADNFRRLQGFIYCCDSNGKEALVRRVLENSMSRPTEEKRFSFLIEDRIDVIDYIANKIYDPGLTVVQKKFLLNKVKSQTQIMIEYFDTLNPEKQSEALDIVSRSDCFFLNKGRFSQVQGIAFCHNFSPSSDSSAYVAAKRLSEINSLENKIIRWDVISKDMSNCRKKDILFDMFYTAFVTNNRIVLPGPAWFNEKSQYQFGCNAFEEMKDTRAGYIYSRSMYAGSHIAAYKYKEKYPDTVWYAELSDPIYMGTDNKERPTAKEYTGDEAFLNTFWKDCEMQVFQTADVIVFTNSNQREYMVSYIEDIQLQDRVMKKSLVLHHPIIDSGFCSIINCEYAMEENKINIGYFGTFYPNRDQSGMFGLLDNKDVVLHLFLPEPDKLKSFASDRVRINQAVGHLEFLNLASKMDYLYLNDIDFEGEINPYLPSKLADYLASGTEIIAKVNPRSVLSGYEHKRLIKITDEKTFANSEGMGIHKKVGAI